ncbi:MAG: S-layer homology domain-containing protein [Defluviitaleaceae bacterium]|nr:S-layer homology domain-containing protein [Defluviitaleaceae bacterium]
MKKNEKKYISLVLVFLMVFGLVLVTPPVAAEAAGSTYYLESDIRHAAGTNTNTDVFPGGGSFAMGGVTYFRGIANSPHGTWNSIITYIIDGRGFTRLTGVFGQITDGGGALIISGDGALLGAFEQNPGDTPIQIDVDIPVGTQRIRIMIERSSGRFGFGDAAFEVGGIATRAPTHPRPASGSAFVESDIRHAAGTNTNTDVFPGDGSFAMGGVTYFRGIANSPHGTWNSYITYNITAHGFTRLTGVFGQIIDGSGALIITGDGALLSAFEQNPGDSPIQVDVTIPLGTQRVRIMIERSSGRFGFGEALFSRGGQPTPAPPAQFTITPSASPSNGGSVTGGGTFNQGASVSLRATANSGWTFSGWYEGGNRVSTSATFNFNATANRTLQARFTQVQMVWIESRAWPANGGTVSKTPSGGVADAQDWSGTYVQLNSTVTLRATANSGWVFDGWFEDWFNPSLVSTNPTFSFIATQSNSIQAVFIQQQHHTITATANPPNGGSVTGGGTFDQGTSVSLRATANSGWTFSGWYEGGNRVSTSATFNFNATTNRTLQALFAQATPAPTPVPAPGPAQTSSVRNPHSSWAAPELERAATLNLIPETLQDPSVDLRNPITRAEFAGVIVRTFEQLSNIPALPAITDPFVDTRDQYVLRAFNTGLMVGISSTHFDPHTLLNREMAATALTRAFKRATIPGWTFATDADHPLQFAWPAQFADDGNISGWARESVYFMAANGIILGTGNNMFSPRAVTNEQQARGYAQATREQALIIALRMIENLG